MRLGRPVRVRQPLPGRHRHADRGPHRGRGAVTDDGFAAAGYGVGALFAVMGFAPMLMAIRGWFAGDDREAQARAARIAAYAQLDGTIPPCPTASTSPSPTRPTR